MMRKYVIGFAGAGAAMMLAACGGAGEAVVAVPEEIAQLVPAAMTEAEARTIVEGRNAEFMTLFAARDAAGLAAQLYTRDGRLIPPDAPDQVGPEAIATYWTAAMVVIKRVELTTAEAVPVGEGYILERTHVKLFAANGMQLGGGKAVILWAEEDGVWKMQWDSFNNGPV